MQAPKPQESNVKRRREADNTTSDHVIVAVRAEKVISKTALAWALTHVVQPGSSLTLLAVFTGQTTRGRRFWNFAKWRADGSGNRERFADRARQISDSCSQMVLQFHDQIEVRVKIKVVSSSPPGAVAAEVKRSAASWVVLDKELKKERKHCMEELSCNIVIMKGSEAQVLRLNLGCSDDLQSPFLSAVSSPALCPQKLQSGSIKYSTPVSSPEDPRSSFTGTTGEASLSISDTMTSLLLVYKQNPLFEGMEKGKCSTYEKLGNSGDALDLDRESMITLSTNPISSTTHKHDSVYWIPQNHIEDEKTPKLKPVKSTTSRTLLGKFLQYDQDVRNELGFNEIYQRDWSFRSNIRESIPLGRTFSAPPPLCSLCRHKAPVFGKPPRLFKYKELVEATDRFSELNLLAVGVFGSVHRGILEDGQVVTVKQLNFAASQGDADFHREVEVLSCAQHRNLVLLIGFCIEGRKRLLVYEYICNGSLDFHLHGKKRMPLDWPSRYKIAIGAARALRYLHEDCRVGCIIHGVVRPDNVLLTHDFEPLVADFGLSRWHCEQGINAEKQDNHTTVYSLYLAPEFLTGGKITEKIDVYAFGVVLLELVTGRRVSDFQVDKRRMILSKSCHSAASLKQGDTLGVNQQLLDPSFASFQHTNFSNQLQAITQAASMCLHQDPESRPPISKVLRVLEGGDAVIPIAMDLNSAGSRSGHMRGLGSLPAVEYMRNHSRKLSH
ncbi:Serine-threonine/tyrosine-protein kinase, catalytic domain [Dillenia turbinata]|uniref:Serine-threonine/tyrosine-protein kinase, catalytic domain n=1 Tax=Dillenia turbinata TaxID=194707 RepID=A0AAN8ZLU2_9MAGN